MCYSFMNDNKINQIVVHKTIMLYCVDLFDFEIKHVFITDLH